ncbi:MAG: tryptophan-rich sensory protein [Candidatus Nanoarchaeia archaeon]|nr:tryptophan-rich sensory protein [Candidatus Nanoarchaeia archaeon]
MNKYLKLLISVLIPLFIGMLGSIFTSTSINTWYISLIKPSFNPPNWIFGPVWTALFILMGLAFFLVWSEETKKLQKYKSGATKLFSIQLMLNLIWSALFFGCRNPLASFIEIIILEFFIIWTTIQFYKVSKPAAYMMIPYILWVAFASALNLAFVILN